MKTRMVIAGGSGFLGRALQRHFETQGWRVVILSRHPTGSEVFWDGKTQGPWSSHLEGSQAVVNLAGRSVNCRYNAKNRAEMMDSRVESTRAIGEGIRACQSPPQVWINASTATIYRHTYGEPWGEDGDISATVEANDALSIEIAQAWEHAVNSVETPSTRKILLRAAMVLGNGPNSVFPTLRRLAHFGLGGRMGSGRQYVSWIHERDFCRAVQWIIENEDLRGPLNISAPGPVTNAEMMRTLRSAVGAPFGLPATKWMLEIGASLMRTETELILKSRRVAPKRLIDSGFQFEFTRIIDAFCDLEDSRGFRPEA